MREITKQRDEALAALERIRAVLNAGPHPRMLGEIQAAVDAVLGPFSYHAGKPCP